jgi:ubiquinone/menaquinone biosynthesis C-methylase UbiE
MQETISTDEVIKEHYKVQAAKHKDSPLSTMEDPITRQKEVAIIENFFQLPSVQKKCKDVLEIGCGNAYTLNILQPRYPNYNFTGLDFSEDLLTIARSRNLPGVKFEQGDARNLQFKDESFDVIYTERCIINLMTWEEQQMALEQMHRVLRKGGYLLFMESFTEGYNNLNKARNELGLDSIPMPHHNLYFDKELFEPLIAEKFEILEEETIPRNFLSSHYFTARVLHPLLTKGDPFMKNTEFVKFFSFLPPSGCYSPIEVYILKKK